MPQVDRFAVTPSRADTIYQRCLYFQTDGGNCTYGIEAADLDCRLPEEAGDCQFGMQIKDFGVAGTEGRCPFKKTVDELGHAAIQSGLPRLRGPSFYYGASGSLEGQ